jgi:hypothetical protein
MNKLILSSIALVFLFSSCKKEEELVVISGNTIPDYNGTPTILVENYVNRLFIDLIGREPTDIEMESKVNFLKSGSLSSAIREQLVDDLMFSNEFIEGDSSYTKAYF